MSAAPREWSTWRKRARRLLPFVLVSSDELRKLRRSTRRYRILRGHVRRDGVVKVAHPRHEAEAEAARRSRNGRTYEAYPCPLCDGLYHVGHRRLP